MSGEVHDAASVSDAVRETSTRDVVSSPSAAALRDTSALSVVSRPSATARATSAPSVASSSSVSTPKCVEPVLDVNLAHPSASTSSSKSTPTTAPRRGKVASLCARFEQPSGPPQAGVPVVPAASS